MSLASILSRIKEVEAAIAQSLANHNALLGRHAELNHLVTTLAEGTPLAPVVDAIEVVEPIAEQVVEAATSST